MLSQMLPQAHQMLSLHSYIDRTNINDIISQLNANIYSVKTVALLVDNSSIWNLNMLNLKPEKDIIRNYITSRVKNDIFYIYDITQITTTRLADTEVIYFCLLGLLLIPVMLSLESYLNYIQPYVNDKVTQGCEITIKIRRLANNRAKCLSGDELS